MIRTQDRSAETLNLDVRLHLGQGTQRGPLTLFPVWSDAPGSRAAYVTGARALLDITERPGDPAVDQVEVTNRSARPALALSGELFEGGRQHRMLMVSAVVAPGMPTVLTAACVEPTRCHGGTAHERRRHRAPLALLPEWTGAKSGVPTREPLSRGLCVPSPRTASLQDGPNRSASATDRLTRGLRPLVGQRGVLVGVAGRPAWLELFDSRAALGSHWTGLLRSAGLHALGRPLIRTPWALAHSFAQRVERADLTPDGSAGLARRLRSDGPISVDSLLWPDRTVHLTAVDGGRPVPAPRRPASIEG